MRPHLPLFAVATLALAAASGCGNVRACKSGTALVTVDFGDGAGADSVLVSASVDGGATVSGTYPHHPGEHSGTIELDFASYPSGHSLTITVSALMGSAIIATNTVTEPLASGCTPIALALGTTDNDMGTTGVVRQLGEACNPGDACVGSTCVDGYCCDSACTDSCAACDIPGSEGKCTVVPAGPPHAGHHCAGDTGGGCDGTCDGVSTTTCVASTASCGPAASCTNGVGTPAGMCSAGTCNQPKMACPDKLCGATACQGVQQMAVGGNFACALISDGTVRCWGSNKSGQLGLGTADTNPHPTPTPVPGLTKVIYLGAGTVHACAILSDHTLRCWGSNSDGQLGIGTAADQNPHPTPMPVCATGSGASCVALTNVNKVVGSPINTCAIVGQTVKCWGDNYDGQIGDGTDSMTTSNNRLNPTQVCTGPTSCGNPIGSVNGGIVDLVMGWYYVCAMDGQSNVFCWGANDSGECGAAPNNPTHFDFPQTVNNIAVGQQKPLHLGAGPYTPCAVISDGNTANNLVRCWGFGGSGERGDSTTNTNQTPSSVCKQAGCGVLLTGATAVGGSNGDTCAVAGGAVYCWGLNTAGQIGKGTVEPNTTKYTVATPSLITTGALDVSGEADAAGFCARMQTGGTLRCWGYNADGECGNGGVVTPQATPVAQSW